LLVEHAWLFSYLAPEHAKRPDWNDVDDGGERHTDNDEDEVGGGQADDEDVGGVPHVLVGGDDHDHRQVPDEAEHSDETEGNWNDDSHEVLEHDVRGTGVLHRAVG